jgi:hypothetical protein
LRLDSAKHDLVEIEYIPYQKIVIHEIIEQDNKVFFEEIVRHALAQPVQAEPSVNWVDGFALLIMPFAPTEDIVRENLAGRIHYSTVVFSKMDFRPQVPVTLGNQTYNVRLRKADNNSNFVDLVAFLKTWKSSTAG